jgi:hypothetical protein
VAMNMRRSLVGCLFVLSVSGICTGAWAQAADPPADVSVDVTGSVVAIAPAVLDAKLAGVQPKDCSPSAPVAKEPDCCRMCPNVYGYMEALFLERGNQSANQPVVITGRWPDASTTVLTTRDLEFDFEPGVRVLAGWRWDDCSCWAVEGSYLGLFDSDATATADRSGQGPGLTFPGGLGPATNVFSDADRIRLDYGSELHTADLSLVCCCCCCDESCDGQVRYRSVDWIFGFRYVDFSERLQFTGERSIAGIPELPSAVYHLQTQNDLYGPQLGVRRRRCLGRFSLEATGKAGIYYNDARQSQYVLDYPNNTVLRDEAASAGLMAFLGEINLSGIYQLTKTWGLRAGYNLIWVEGVALAPDQLDFSGAIPAGNQLSSNGLFLHGVNVGLEARW